MTKKWKIFGIQTNIEWYDVRKKFKQSLRKILYSWLFQELICLIAVSYMKFVFCSSRKIYINYDKVFVCAEGKAPLIVAFWHNRLMMASFATRKVKKFYPDFNLMTLSSRHGDGKIVGKVMEKLGLISISGSSRDGRKASRGIDFSSMKKIIDGLRKGFFLAITPDGPRGPNQKINGELVNIARVSGAKILTMSYSSSRFKKLKTWDRFIFPFPFSTLCFYFDDRLVSVEKNMSKEEMGKIRIFIEERANLVQEKSQEIANNS